MPSLVKTVVAVADDHMSYEHVCSGPGLMNIYRFLRQRSQTPEPASPGQLFIHSAILFIRNRWTIRTYRGVELTDRMKSMAKRV